MCAQVFPFPWCTPSPNMVPLKKKFSPILQLPSCKTLPILFWSSFFLKNLNKAHEKAKDKTSLSYVYWDTLIRIQSGSRSSTLLITLSASPYLVVPEGRVGGEGGPGRGAQLLLYGGGPAVQPDVLLLYWHGHRLRPIQIFHLQMLFAS